MKNAPLSSYARPPKYAGDSARIAEEQRDFVRGWLAHVEAGRIGPSCRSTASLHETKPTTTTPEQLRTHVRNELVLCGRIY